MDFLPSIETFSTWLVHYGPFMLFIFLILGILALPIPEETLMVISGILMSHGKLSIVPVVIAAFLGSICGITLSYLLGRLASDFFLNKIGKWKKVQKKLEKVLIWYQRYGKWTLMIGYFIPGVRHVTGISAGMTKLRLKDFALFAYTGACIWVTIFLCLGYFFGGYWISVFKHIGH